MQINNARYATVWAKTARDKRKENMKLGINAILRHDDQPVTPVDRVELGGVKTRDEAMGHWGSD